MQLNQKKMTEEELVTIGFVVNPIMIICLSLNYDLGRDRYISVQSPGTPNEMIFICEMDRESLKITDIVVIKNYDYDGYTSIEDVKLLISLIG
jgi:hypothetical protein